jgi:hypothetical protein
MPSLRQCASVWIILWLVSAVSNAQESPRLDYGDAPDLPRLSLYPTLLVHDGARHQYNASVFLGSRIDLEQNGQPDSEATGDDTDAGGDDEDGVIFTSPWIPGDFAEIRVVASTRGQLNAWADFNADGDWADTGEQILNDATVTAGTNLLMVDVPDSAVVGTTFARFRFDLKGGLSYTGLASTGEVEDYQVTIEAPQAKLDFGDAPGGAAAPGYPTLLSNNGACHRIGGPWFGSDKDAPDAESDGQPDAAAMGDDSHGTDDENGVTIPVLQPGDKATVSFVVNGGGGLVRAWIDFDGDHQWEAFEQIVSGYFLNGLHQVTIAVPGDSKPGETFARFRISSAPTAPEGLADDGEVEDHRVVIRSRVKPDHFEPNNSLAQAIDLGMFGQRRIGLTMNGEGDEDWYKWHSGPGGQLKVDLGPETGQAEFQAAVFDMELHGSDGKLLARAAASDNGKTLSFAVAGDEAYFIRVVGHGTLLDPNYVLDILFQGSENYAVLFAGGARPAKNFQRYYNNTKALYNILVGTYKLDPDNIYILYADGTDPEADLSSGDDFVNSDMSYAAHVLSATPENLEDVLVNIMAPRIDWNDHFFFWSFDHGGGSKDEPGTLDEEVLTGWYSSISDEDLAAWLRSIHPGRFTFVATQCYAGGMLDNLLPLTTTEHGCAATNHYESSWGDAFAAAYNDGLMSYTQSHDVYRYAYTHDGYATDGEGPGGDVADHLEHPWEATQSNFPIFSDNSNHLPWIEKVRELKFVPPWEEIIIPYELLRGATELGDFDIKGAGFRVESMLQGTLLKNGEPVVPGQTLVGPGESLVYVPAIQGGQNQATPPNEVFEAFTVRASDGATISDQKLAVPMVLNEDGLLDARDDHVMVDEDVQDAEIDVLANDQGMLPRSVVSVGNAAHGTVQLVNGLVLYSPAAEYAGEDSFIYFMTNASGRTDWANVSIEVLPVNDPPEAYSDLFTVAQDSKDQLVDVLDNDFDKELKPLTYDVSQSGQYPMSAVVVDPPSQGKLSLQKNGTFLYTPNRGFVGVDLFTYRADDGEFLSDVVTATIEVGPQNRLKWVQTPDTTQGSMDIRLDKNTVVHRALADDFSCTDTGMITEISLWGSWLRDVKGEITRLQLSLYSDYAAGIVRRDPGNLFARPDRLLWQKTFKPGQFEERLSSTDKSGDYWWDMIGQGLISTAHTEVWQVRVPLDEKDTFHQEGTPEKPVVYWLEAQVETSGGQFGWKTRRWPDHFNHNAVFQVDGSDAFNWQALTYPVDHPNSGLHFEDLVKGSVFQVGNSFTTAFVPLYVKSFQVSNGQWTGRGSVSVASGALAGGTGLGLAVHNANVAFQFPAVLKALDIRYGDDGGNLNLNLNGDFRNFNDFEDINGAVIGGVQVAVATDPDPHTGTLFLEGTINSLVLGGQALLIDHIEWPNSLDLAFSISTEPDRESRGGI